MAQYLIHSVPQRKWYVDEYLIPSMLKQGIKRLNITIYTDTNNFGNLKAFFDSLYCIDKLSDRLGTWHLQDDIVISSDFREQTEKYNEGIVNGFCSNLYDDSSFQGQVDKINLWKGFQCIRIPNYLIKESMVWCKEFIINNPVYSQYWTTGYNDDWMFRSFLKANDIHEKFINLAPNIVNHIDYLIGDSIITTRKEHLISQCWEDDSIVEDLCNQLSGK